LTLATVTIAQDKQLVSLMEKLNEMIKIKSGDVEPVTYYQQIINSIAFGPNEDADKEEDKWPDLFDLFCHFLCFNWKFLFGLMPPSKYKSGYPLFVVSLIAIGILTMVVGDIAKIFGCLVGMSDLLTAITFVALGTSLPDTLASMSAANEDDSADNAVGNVTGSNSVNVFLGQGLVWMLGAHYHAAMETKTIDIPGYCVEKYGD